MHDPWTLVAQFPPYAWRKGVPLLRPIVEVWHHDPSDYDSETCGRDFRKLSHWRHWSIRLLPLRQLQRRLFQRCAWCGGWSTKRNPVDCSAQSSERQDNARWWWSRPDVYHRECSGAHHKRLMAIIQNAERRGQEKTLHDLMWPPKENER